MGVTARGSGDSPTRHKMLGIYLNDHLAGATAGVELARRMVQEHGDSAYKDEWKRLAAEVSQDRQALLRLLADLDVPVKRYKVYGAWAGEKVGRVKLNGRLLRRSGLTVLVEVEAMRLGVQGKALLWRSLLSAAAHDSRFDPGLLEQLLQRSEQQITLLDSLHTKIASALLPPATPREPAAHAVPERTADAITPEQVEALLESDADEPTLIIAAGAVVVLPASALDTERYRGAMEIISRQDLAAQLGTDVPSRRDLEEIATRLSATVTQLGA